MKSKKVFVVFAVIVVFAVLQITSVIYNYNASIQHGGEMAKFAKESITIQTMWPLIVKLSLLLLGAGALIAQRQITILLFGILLVFIFGSDVFSTYQHLSDLTSPLETIHYAITLVTFLTTFVIYGGLLAYSLKLKNQGYFKT